MLTWSCFCCISCDVCNSLSSKNSSLQSTLTIVYIQIHGYFHDCRIWFSYINPIFWTVYGLIISQVGNLSIGCTLSSGEVQPVYTAVLTLFGYHRGMIGWIVLILCAWVFINWTLTYVALSRLNYLKRWTYLRRLLCHHILGTVQVYWTTAQGVSLWLYSSCK